MGVATWVALAAAASSAYSANRQASAAKSASHGTTTTDIPEWQRAQMQYGMSLANTAAQRPADQAVVGFNDNQNQAFANVLAHQGQGESDMDSVIDTGKGLTGDVNYSDVDVQKYMNPYTDSVVNSTIDDLQRIRGINSAQIKSQAEAAGAFGGDRSVLAESLSNESADRTAASTIANTRMQGFQNAAQLAQSDAQMKNQFALGSRNLSLAGNAQLAQLIAQRRGMSSADDASLLAIGNQQQALDQSRADWPIQAAQLVSGAANGNAGQSTSYQTYGPSMDRTAATLQGLQYGLSAYNAYTGYNANQWSNYMSNTAQNVNTNYGISPYGADIGQYMGGSVA